MKLKVLVATALLFPMLAFGAVKSDLLKSLYKTDKLQIIINNINQIWNDGNITTGTSVVSGADLKTKAPHAAADWKKLGEKLFADVFEYYEGEALPKGVSFEIKASEFEWTDVETAVAAVAEGNAYSDKNSEGRNAIRSQVWKMVRTLGLEEQIQAISVNTRLKDDSTGDKRNVRLNIFINRDNGKTVLIYTIEGTI